MFTIQKNFDTTPLSSLKIGGRVRYFVELEEEADLPELFSQIKRSRLPYFVFGGSSNLFLADKNYKGWAVKIALKGIRQKDNFFQAKAGNLLAELIRQTIQTGYGGLHKLSGIPGTVGGAIRNNAGSYGTEISDTLLETKIFSVPEMKFKIFQKKECNFQYRKSIFVSQQGIIIVSAKFSLRKEDKKKLLDEAEKILSQRSKLPYAFYPSGGSIFKNIPLEQIKDRKNRDILLSDYLEKTGLQKTHFIPAGYLLENLGLKGEKIGQACFSKEHGNIIINLGNAKPEDVLALIALAKKRARDKWGIPLEEEIVCVGI
jgi:UDP-N-acetylmuramate dehydrogenase